MDTGDPSWIEPVLDEWLEARTETDLETTELGVHPILNEIALLTTETAQDNLEAQDALALNSALLPIFLHGLSYVTRQEIAAHIEHLTEEFEQAKSSLHRLERTKSDFIAIAAHELKTPLTLIEGYSAMLRDQVSHLDDERAASDLEDFTPNTIILLKGMDNGTRRLREIVDDMVDVSLIDNEMLALRHQPIWLNRIFGTLSQEVAQGVAERNQTLDVRAFSGSDEYTFGDELRLFQAFRNLLSNAIKYTPDGGKIIIDGRILPGFIEVTVADNGIGIDPENHMAIFEKFGRLGNVALHSSGKTKFKGGGPGLGLPIAKGIIEAHGGTIWVESAGYDEKACIESDEMRTIFHIMLPLRKDAPDENSARLFKSLLKPDISTANG